MLVFNKILKSRKILSLTTKNANKFSTNIEVLKTKVDRNFEKFQVIYYTTAILFLNN